jgi:hypothetical protein
MKTFKSALSVLFLTGAMGLSVASTRAAGIISKDVLSEGSYCHMKFPAVREETLGTSYPVLKDASSGDIIDFYGSCDHDPLGKDEINSQLLQQQHRRDRDYSG